MAFDVSFITPELNRESQIPDGDIMVFDLQELPLNLWTKISLTYMRMLSEYMHVCFYTNSFQNLYIFLNTIFK